MATWTPIVGKAFTAEEFDNYCRSLKWDKWRPSFIVLHNTGTLLKHRPKGMTAQKIRDNEARYRDEKKWSAGPHLFIDDNKIWVFTPLTVQGVHSPTWNKTALGFEMIGNYDHDDFMTGRGLLVQKNAIAAIASVSTRLGIDPDTMKLHKEDKATSHTDCPGKAVDKQFVINEVKRLIVLRSEAKL